MVTFVLPCTILHFQSVLIINLINPNFAAVPRPAARGGAAAGAVGGAGQPGAVHVGRGGGAIRGLRNRQLGGPARQEQRRLPRRLQRGGELPSWPSASVLNLI